MPTSSKGGAGIALYGNKDYFDINALCILNKRLKNRKSGTSGFTNPTFFFCA